MSSDLSTGKTIFILAVVVGCFAVLWPKVFYPMLTASVKQSGSTQVVNWRDQGNVRVLSQLCFLIEEQQDPSGFSRLTDEVCIEFVRKSCGVTVNEKVAEDFRLSKDKTNLTFCLQQKFDITLDNVLSTAPPPARTKPYQPQSLPHPHVRPERPSHLHPEVLHPALRDKGRTIPHRTIEKQARPGPMPGVRPPMGGGGHMVPPQTKGSGAMGIIMPLYTVGIVIFFVYTIMKVLFKKSDDEETKIPKLKDFHLDPEYRKYVFTEEYLDSSNVSHRDLLKRQERESSKQRRRQDSTSQPDTKIEDEQMDQLRRRLEETEKAMERLMSQMGSVTDKLTAAKITEVLSQAQSQARILKMGLDNVVSSDSVEGNEASVHPAPSSSLTTTTLTSTPSKVTFVPSPPQIFYTMDAAEGGSDEDLTTSEAFTNTLSEDFSLPLALQRHLEELKVKDMYLKGTSAGNFGSPPISPDELDSPNGRHNSIQGSAPLIATNTTLLSSFTKENDAIPNDKSSQLDNIGIGKNNQNEQIKECILDQQDVKQIPVVDFPLQISSSLKQNLKNDKKQKEDLVLSSDIAQYDAAGGHSDREGSSDTSETGADISDLKSFADNGAIEVTGSVPIPVVEEQAVPEVTYSPRFTEALETEEESVMRKPATPSADDKQYNIHVKSPAVEHGTQTEENQKLSVLNLRTTYLIDKNEQKKGLNIKEVEDKVNEIVLDATLPIDTQLLVKEAQTGSAVTNNIEIDASEIGSEPCVVTSQVSLAFIGLEHNDIEGPYTLVVPEARPKESSENQNVKIFQHPLPKQEVKLADFIEERKSSETKEHFQNVEVKLDEIISDKYSEHAFLTKQLDSKDSLFYKSNNAIQQPEENSELNQQKPLPKQEVKSANFVEGIAKSETREYSSKEDEKLEEIFKSEKNNEHAFLSKESDSKDSLFYKRNNTIQHPEEINEVNQEKSLPKQEGNKVDLVEGGTSSETQEHSEKDSIISDLKSGKTHGHAFLSKDSDSKDSLLYKSNNTIQQPEESDELNKKNLIDSEITDLTNLSLLRKESPENRFGNNKNQVSLQCSLKNEEPSAELICASQCSEITQQQVQDISKDSSNVKDDVPFQSIQNKELIHGDPFHLEENKSFIQSELIIEVQPQESNEKTVVFPQHFTDKDEKNCSEFSQQEVQGLTKDSSNINNDNLLFHVDDSSILHQSELINEVERIARNDENIVISQHLTDKDEKIFSEQIDILDNTLGQNLSEDLDCGGNEKSSIINSDILCTKELISDKNLDDSIKSDDRLCEGLSEFPKTISVESFDLTPEILHGLEEPSNEEEFIAIEFMRPQSPVPPSSDNSKAEDRDTLSLNGEQKLIPEVYNDVKVTVQDLASTLVEETTKNALQHISSLTSDEICKHKNEALNISETSRDITQNEKINVPSENTKQSNYSLERNLNFQSKINVQEQPGEVVSSGESGGENENIFVATIHCISKVSPPGSPFASEINKSFSLENVNLTDHCTQSVTPTPLIEDPALKTEDGCTKELRSPSPDSSILIAETTREQESAFRRSSLESHETDMNHKG